MRYSHTQTAPWSLLLVGIGVLMVAVGWTVPITFVMVLLWMAGSAMVFLAFCFRQLTVCDDGDALRIAFGPLPFFSRRLAYADITSAERSRTTVLDGWGIHYSMRGGWVWNLWGFDCVNITYSRTPGDKPTVLHIGTDDADALASFLTDQAIPK